MTDTPQSRHPEPPPPSCPWHDLAARVLAGHRLNHEEGLAILHSGDEQLLDLLAAAYRVRYRFFGNRVHLNFLINAKSGRCGEDCGYCSQSKVSRADDPRVPPPGPGADPRRAQRAAERRARTYCIVISGRSPTPQDLDAIAELVPRIKAAFALKVCLSPGLLTPDQAARLKAAGVDRVNHNLNTSRRFYPRICTTHTYDERLDTLRAVRDAGPGDLLAAGSSAWARRTPTWSSWPCSSASWPPRRCR